MTLTSLAFALTLVAPYAKAEPLEELNNTLSQTVTNVTNQVLNPINQVENTINQTIGGTVNQVEDTINQTVGGAVDGVLEPIQDTIGGIFGGGSHGRRRPFSILSNRSSALLPIFFRTF